MKSPPFKVGDLVTPSSKALGMHWWKSHAFAYMIGAEFIVTKVEVGITVKEYIIYFHDPKFGTRRWRASYLTAATFTLENE